MLALAAAFEKRSLSAFETALKEFPAELGQKVEDSMEMEGSAADVGSGGADPLGLIRRLVLKSFEEMMEQNLLRVVEPFSRVEIAHVAGLVGRPVPDVQRECRVKAEGSTSPASPLALLLCIPDRVQIHICRVMR